MKQRAAAWLLVLVLCGGFLVRYAHLGYHDLHGDEALNAARAMHWFDFLQSSNQTTPVQWFPERQWWQPMSFHDHPPLGFAFQFATMRLFGDSVVGLRFPFVLVGVMCIGVAFLLVKQLTKNETVAVGAAFMIAFLPSAVWISRYALYDGLVVLWMLTSLWLWVKAQGNEKYFLWWGAVVGLGLMTKYTFVVMVAFFAVHALLKRSVIKKKEFWQGIGIAFLILLPVIVYNIMMFKTRGHFDAAFSSMVGMHPADFELIAGRAGGANFGNFLATIRMLPLSLGWLATGFLCFWIIVVFGRCIRKKVHEEDIMVVIYVGLLVLFFVVLQPERRFLTVLIPLVVVAGAGFFQELFGLKNRFPQQQKIVRGMVYVCAVIYLLTSLYTVNGGFEQSRGYNALYKKFDDLFRGGVAEYLFTGWEDPQVVAKQKQFQGKPVGFPVKNKHTNTVFVLMDTRIEWAAQFWLASRYFAYAAMPVLDISDFVNIVQPNNTPVTFPVDVGFTDFYIISSPQEAQSDNDKNVAEALAVVTDIFRKDPRFIKETEENISRGTESSDMLRIVHIQMKPGPLKPLTKTPIK